jgi:hypothetical protein
MVVSRPKIFEHERTWIIVAIFDRSVATDQWWRTEGCRKLAVELQLAASPIANIKRYVS